MLISILRTIVPALWGSFIAWVLGVAPVLEPLRADLLAYGDLAVPFISAVIIGAWYALWRRWEHKLPDWLTRILLGSAKAPVYESIPGEFVETEAPGRHGAITQADTTDTSVHSKYPIADEHEPTRPDESRYP